MDVTNRTFQSLLHSILNAISNSTFISIDLELSGIPGRQPKKTRAPGQGETGKQTLQQRYEDTKKAAERYQVLQLGLTCVEEDLQRGVYIARPYNFFLNPVPDKRLEVEREFTYHSGAVDFLLGHKFRMEAPFLQGVPYFSREEEKTAREIAAARQNKDSVPDISIQEGDTTSFELIRRVRREVAAWKNRGTPEPSYLNIAPIGHGSPNYNGRGLNGYQKRLIHQFIRAEHPDLVSASRLDFVQVSPYVQEQEEANKEKRMQWFQERLASQIGLRWVVEAMCPNAGSVPHFSDVMEWGFPPVEMTEQNTQAFRNRFVQLLHRLREKRPVLVGHNLFLDLIYFYRCFFGPLPDRVQDFQSAMGDLFPMIFDTKYLADSVNDNSPLYKSSLEEIDEELSKLPTPVIEVPFEHGKYDSHSPAHEAGFDSFLTAKVFIRLSARTEAAANNASAHSNGLYRTVSEDGGVLLNQPYYPRTFLTRAGFSANGHYEHGPIDSSSDDEAFLTSDEYSTHQQHSPRKRDSNLRRTTSTAGLSHANLFDLLENHGDDDPHTKTVPMMMPHEDSSFWFQYGNKLRVNGTVEEVCILG